eukprot:scaffold1827_cov421-Prasinococcus_capsulatus_cf.AAC.11
MLLPRAVPSGHRRAGFAGPVRCGLPELTLISNYTHVFSSSCAFYLHLPPRPPGRGWMRRAGGRGVGNTGVEKACSGAAPAGGAARRAAGLASVDLGRAEHVHKQS